MNNTINAIRMIQMRILTSTAMCVEYDSWSDEFQVKEIARAMSPKSNFGFSEIPMIQKEDLEAMTWSELVDFGFVNWGSELLLIPLYLAPFMDPDMELTSIMGKVSTLSECDKDARQGCIAFGIEYPKP